MVSKTNVPQGKHWTENGKIQESAQCVFLELKAEYKGLHELEKHVTCLLKREVVEMRTFFIQAFILLKTRSC